jgi:NADH-quinone oxidoreductase subunit N
VVDQSGYPTALYAAVVVAGVITVLLLPAIGLFSGTAFEAAAALL